MQLKELFQSNGEREQERKHGLYSSVILSLLLPFPLQIIGTVTQTIYTWVSSWLFISLISWYILKTQDFCTLDSVSQLGLLLSATWEQLAAGNLQGESAWGILAENVVGVEFVLSLPSESLLWCEFTLKTGSCSDPYSAASSPCCESHWESLRDSWLFF